MAAVLLAQQKGDNFTCFYGRAAINVSLVFTVSAAAVCARLPWTLAQRILSVALKLQMNKKLVAAII